MDTNTEPTNTPAPETTSAEATASQTAAVSEATPKTSNRNLIFGIVVMVLALGIGYVTLFTDIKLTSYLPFTQTAVATVNGVTISEAEYNNSAASVRANIEAQGGDVATEGAQASIQSQAISQLINAELLIQAAEAAGYSAEQAEIDEQIASIEENFGGAEAFAERLEELNITQEMFRQDVYEQVMVTAFIEGETDIAQTEVSDEEIDAFYKNIQAQYGEDIPSAEDLREQIVADIQIQKQQEQLGELLAELRAAADIEINL